MVGSICLFSFFGRGVERAVFGVELCVGAFHHGWDSGQGVDSGCEVMFFLEVLVKLFESVREGGVCVHLDGDGCAVCWQWWESYG